MSVPVETLAIAALIVGVAYIAFGLTGFGSTVLALPLLAHVLPLKFAVPLLMLLDLAAGLVLGVRARKGIRTDELAWFAPFMLAGMVFGLVLLVRVAEVRLIAALGVFVLLYALYGLARRAPLALSRRWCGPLGVASGAFSALYGTGGVIAAVYLSGRLQDKAQLRATTATVILFSALARAVLFGVSGLLTQDGLLGAALVLAPAALAGYWVGHRLHAAVPTRAVVRAMRALLVLAGVSLLARAATL